MKTTNKILVVCLGNRGGLVEYTKNICKYFVLEKYDILAFSDSQFSKLPNVIKVTRYKNKLSFIFLTCFYLPIVVTKVVHRIREYDILYIPGPFLWNLPFVIIFRLFNKKVVLTVHDDKLHSGQENILEQWLLNKTIELCDNFIFLTEYVYHSAKLKFPNLSNIKVIPHGIFPIRDIDFTQRLERNRILFIGRILKYKGVEVLVEAVNKLGNNYELMIAGNANYELSINYSSKNITLVNKFLTEEEIAEKLSWCDIIVLPYLEATQSGIVSLGIFAEKPMICTDVGGLSEQVTKQEAFFIKPNNVDELIDAIFKLSNDSDRYEKIRNALKIKKEYLKWENISSEVMCFLNS